MRGIAVLGRTVATLTLAILLAFVFGCSSGGTQPVTPGEDNLHQVNTDLNEGHNILGLYIMSINTEEMTVNLIPSHSALIHVNVAPYLLATCPDCIKVALTGYKPDERKFTIQVDLVNPMLKVGYNVKGIISLDGTGEYNLLNPDCYYALWSPQISPFRYFAKDAPNMQFPPAAAYKETFEIYISETHTPLFNIPYAIDAHWPGIQEDPIWVRNIVVNNNGTTVTIDCDVIDAQNNVEKVWADTTAFTGGTTNFVKVTGNTYRGTFPVGTAPGGLNKVLISAKSIGTTVLMYNYADVFVEATGAILEGKVFNALTVQNAIGTKLTVTNVVAGGFEPLPTVIGSEGTYYYDMQPGSYNIEVITNTSAIVYDKMPTIYPVVINPDDHIVVSFGLGPANLNDNTEQICCINGQVFNAVTGDPVAFAQVSISGGTQTGGTFQNRVTDARGHYVFWKVPCKDNKLVPIANFTITCVADGYLPGQRDAVPYGWNKNTPQENFYLTPIQANCVWEDSFENGGLPGWTFQGLQWGQLWHIRPDAELYNANVTMDCSDGGKIVILPPDDTTNGRVWETWHGTWSLWYGQEENGSFIGAWANNNPGGTSVGPNAARAFSPEIDLTAYPKATILWRQIWEIEGVDPSIQYDYMKVSIKEVGTTDWILFEHSNPTTEPVPDLGAGNAKHPQTSAGFDQAAVWQAIVHILNDLDNPSTPDHDHLNFAGKKVQLRFEFGTVDHLYNGFRGWLLDDLCILPGAPG